MLGAESEDRSFPLQGARNFTRLTKRSSHFKLREGHSPMKPFLLATLAVTLATSASADDFPSRAFRIIVAYSAGGTADAAARLAVGPLSRQLGQSVYIENRPGSGGMSGTQAYF